MGCSRGRSMVPRGLRRGPKRSIKLRPVSSDVAIVTTAWGDYWDRFGDRWMQSVLALEDTPGEVIIASDRLLDVPDGWRVVTAVEPHFLDAWYWAIHRAHSPLIFMCGLDDEVTPNAMTDLPEVWDVVYGPQMAGDKIHGPNREGWERILEETEDWFPCTGWNLIRRDIYLKYPQRRVVWADWIMAMEFKYHGVDVRFDDTIRQRYNLHDGQHSRSQSMKPLVNIRKYRPYIKAGRVLPGLEWPPICT